MATPFYDPNYPQSLLNYIYSLEAQMKQKDQIIASQAQEITQLSHNASKSITTLQLTPITFQQHVFTVSNDSPKCTDNSILCSPDPQPLLLTAPLIEISTTSSTDKLKISLASVPVHHDDDDSDLDEFDQEHSQMDDTNETQAPPPPPPHRNAKQTQKLPQNKQKIDTRVVTILPPVLTISGSHDSVSSQIPPPGGAPTPRIVIHPSNASTSSGAYSNPTSPLNSVPRREPRGSVVWPIGHNSDQPVPPIPRELYIGVHLGQSELDLCRRQSQQSKSSHHKDVVHPTSLSRFNSTANSTIHSPSTQNNHVIKKTTPMPNSTLELGATSLTLSLSSINSSMLSSHHQNQNRGRVSIINYALPNADGNTNTVVDLAGNSQQRAIALPGRRASITGTGTMTPSQINSLSQYQQSAAPETALLPHSPQPYSHTTLRRRASITTGTSPMSFDNLSLSPPPPPPQSSNPNKFPVLVNASLFRTGSAHSSYSTLSTSTTKPGPSTSTSTALQRVGSTGPPPIPLAILLRTSSSTQPPPPPPPPIQTQSLAISSNNDSNDQHADFGISSPNLSTTNQQVLPHPLQIPSVSFDSTNSFPKNLNTTRTARTMPSLSPFQQPRDSSTQLPPLAVSSHFTNSNSFSDLTPTAAQSIENSQSNHWLPPPPPPPPPLSPTSTTSKSPFISEQSPSQPSQPPPTSPPSASTQISPIISTQFDASALQPNFQQKKQYGTYNHRTSTLGRPQ